MTPPPDRRMTGVVLAGGASQRMGRDKALLKVGGSRLIDRAIATLAAACETVVVAAGGRRIDDIGVACIDDAAGEGPLAGIVAALTTAQTPLVAVLAVDMPHASAEVFTALASAWDGQPAVAPRAGGSVQPLHAVYATQAAGDFEALLVAGERSPRAAIDRLGGAIVDASRYDPAGTAGPFWVNVNQPEDLASVADRPATP